MIRELDGAPMRNSDELTTPFQQLETDDGERLLEEEHQQQQEEDDTSDLQPLVEQV
jgi:hypothetical protein